MPDDIAQWKSEREKLPAQLNGLESSVIEPEAWLDLLILLAFFSCAPAERNEITSETHERASGDGGRERLRNPHHPYVGVDCPIEGKILREGIDEHQRIVHMCANDCLLSPRLRKAKPPLGVGIQLSSENRFRKQSTEHVTFRI